MRPVALLAIALSCIGFATAASGSKKQFDNRAPFKLAIRHADPWAVKAMLEGAQLSQPEISTISGVTGGNRQNGNTQQNKTSPLLQDGYLVVNPTDNSLWWYPNKR